MDAADGFTEAVLLGMGGSSLLGLGLNKSRLHGHHGSKGALGGADEACDGPKLALLRFAAQGA